MTNINTKMRTFALLLLWIAKSLCSMRYVTRSVLVQTTASGKRPVEQRNRDLLSTKTEPPSSLPRTCLVHSRRGSCVVITSSSDKRQINMNICVGGRRSTSGRHSPISRGWCLFTSATSLKLSHPARTPLFFPSRSSASTHPTPSACGWATVYARIRLLATTWLLLRKHASTGKVYRHQLEDTHDGLSQIVSFALDEPDIHG